MSPLKPLESLAPELLLGPEQERPYGFRQEGYVLHGQTHTPVTVRLPYDNTDSVYVLGNGWTGDKNSMRVPAIEAVHAGHMAVTFSYTHTGSNAALESNATEMAAVIDALPGSMTKNAMGLSMGGWVTLKAVELADSPVQNVTLVASAGFTSRTPTQAEVALHLVAESQELALEYLRDPVGAAKVAYSSVRNVLRRHGAVRAEIGELVRGSAIPALHAVKGLEEVPHVRFAYGNNDLLIPAHEQLAGARDQPFDHIMSYRGGHVAAVFRPAVSRQFFALDAQQSELLAA